jgi:hypothetical protein
MIPRRTHNTRWRSLWAAAILSLAVAALMATPALAAEDPPHWHLETIAYPTNLPLEGESLIVVTASNLGATPVNGAGQKVTITDTLPEGAEATLVRGSSAGNTYRSILNRDEIQHKFNPTGFDCTQTSARDISCTFEQKLAPFEQLEISITVKTHFESVPESEPVNEVTAEGGEAAKESSDAPLKVNGARTEFGVESYKLIPENANGTVDTEAGSHPFQLTTFFNLNTRYVPIPSEEKGKPAQPAPVTPALQKDLTFKLPPGLIGDANVVGNENAPQQCEGVAFGTLSSQGVNACPPDTAIGVAAVDIEDPITVGFTTKLVPVFNLVPAPGEPARFGFSVDKVPVVLDTALETGGQYAATVSIHNLAQTIYILSSRVTFWGVPEEASHNEARGWNCLGWAEEGCIAHEVPKPSPFLTLPTSCTGRPTTTVGIESWPYEEGGVTKVSNVIPGEHGENSENAEYKFPAPLTGCENLNFAFPGSTPTISVTPDTEEANTPTGLTVDVRVPQEASLEVGKQAEPAVKDTTVEFPQGLLLNPSAANGLEACAEGEREASGGIGYTGPVELSKELKELEPGNVTDGFTEKLPEPLEPGSNFCPNGSKVGVVHIKTPDLPNELEGGVYLAAQTANPFGSLFAMYIVAQDPISKVLIKAAGELSVSPTGQVTSTFKNTPDAPFEDLKIELFNGPRASLTTPAACGSYETNASFTPWSTNPQEPEKEPKAVTVHAKPFQISSGCPNPVPFEPSFKAGVSNTQGGAFTPFTLTITVPQDDSALKTVSNMQLPEGLAAVLASVTPCPEPQAAEGNCGAESEIGTSTALTGLGSDPFSLPGKVYLTGPYDGAPFGLSAVTEATAGPFHLGRVVVRSSIAINTYTAAATINTEAARYISYKGTVTEFTGLPEFIEGVPSQIKALEVNVNRQNFEFNPTNCKAQSITATLKGATGEKAVSANYQPTNCASLPFHPVLTASVAGQGSKEDGTTFSVKIESAGLGQANIHKADLTIPASLPSRLTTIQKACVDSVFEADPANCDEGSLIGEGIVHTPVFKNPLRGPAYLVSHGGAAFPDVEFVLQGEGVTIIVDGKTDIKHGITYSKFETSPDAPFTSFETVFPAGPHSALTPNVPEDEYFNLCKTSLTVPTELTGQNGAFISENTKVQVTGCKGVKSFKETKAQELAKALKACKKDKRKSKRVACEKAARKKYGKKVAKKAKTKRKK